MDHVRIHRYSAGPQGALVNAYLVETAEGIVAVDGTLTVTDGRALRSQLDSLGKPLLAALVTHSHPDHYGGLVELVGEDAVPVIATAGVDGVIRRDDAVKEEILTPHVRGRVAPGTHLPHPHRSGRRDARPRRRSFTVLDLGPGESPHDSIWLLGGDRAPTSSPAIRPTIDCTPTSPTASTRSGSPTSNGCAGSCLRTRPCTSATAARSLPAQLVWQREYVETFVDAVRTADWSRPEAATRLWSTG